MRSYISDMGKIGNLSGPIFLLILMEIMQFIFVNVGI